MRYGTSPQNIEARLFPVSMNSGRKVLSEAGASDGFSYATHRSPLRKSSIIGSPIRRHETPVQVNLLVLLTCANTERERLSHPL